MNANSISARPSVLAPSGSVGCPRRSALDRLSMPQENLPLLMTALPDILDKFVVLLDEMQMPHIDVRCPVLRTLRNLSYQGHDARMKIATEPSMLARVGQNGRGFALAELCLL